jgi:hypothetical protein
MICHQRQIRDRLAGEQPRPVMSSLSGCRVAEINLPQAEHIILTYEWLGNIGKWKLPDACYGLLGPSDELLGAVMFSSGPHNTRRILFGHDSDKAICLERGACVHWAHEHAASFLIGRATRLAAQAKGWELFYAYSDPAAGEIGTVYQATNWIYFGLGPGNTRRNGVRYALRPPGVVPGDFLNYLDTRCLRRKGPVLTAIENYCRDKGIPFDGKGTFALARHVNYPPEKTRPEKHLYVLPVRRRSYWLKFFAEKNWEQKSYPKRDLHPCAPIPTGGT